MLDGVGHPGLGAFWNESCGLGVCEEVILWRASRQRHVEQLRLLEPIPASPSVEGLSLHIAGPQIISRYDEREECGPCSIT